MPTLNDFNLIAATDILPYSVVGITQSGGVLKVYPCTQIYHYICGVANSAGATAGSPVTLQPGPNYILRTENWIKGGTVSEEYKTYKFGACTIRGGMVVPNANAENPGAVDGYPYATGPLANPPGKINVQFIALESLNPLDLIDNPPGQPILFWATKIPGEHNLFNVG